MTQPVPEELLEKLLEILPSNPLCSHCDGLGGWVSTDYDATAPKHTYVVCPHCDGKQAKETQDEMLKIIKKALQAERQALRDKIVKLSKTKSPLEFREDVLAIVDKEEDAK